MSVFIQVTVIFIQYFMFMNEITWRTDIADVHEQFGLEVGGEGRTSGQEMLLSRRLMSKMLTFVSSI